MLAVIKVASTAGVSAAYKDIIVSIAQVFIPANYQAYNLDREPSTLIVNSFFFFFLSWRFAVSFLFPLFWTGYVVMRLFVSINLALRAW